MVKTIGFLLAAICAMATSFGFYSDTLRAPNDYCLSGRDGVKNYFTFIYHVRHDSCFSRFEGMNYPFGEHVVFTDAQPLLSGALQALKRWGWDFSSYGVGIINVLPWLGLGLCAGTLWLLMTRFGVGPTFAFGAAVAVALMNPTLRRWESHFALSYGFFLPVVWLLALRWFERFRLADSLALSLFVTVFAWIHLYWAAMAALFLTAMWIIRALRTPGMLSRVPHFLLQVVIPMASVKIWLWLTDPVFDRPDDPYGFLVYRSAWEGIFLPLDMPLAELIERFVNIRDVEREGKAYVGLGATVLSAAMLVAAVRTAFFHRRAPKPAATPLLLRQSLTAALIVLLFSFGLPFVLLPEKVLGWTGALRQFRSLGRFAWWFYFVMNVYATVWVYRKCVAGDLWRGRWAAALFFGAWIYEIPCYHRGLGLFGEKTDNPFNNSWPVSRNDFQAVVPRPYFHIGSERLNFGEHTLDSIAPAAFSLSAATGLPLTAVMASRTSFSQTMENIGWGVEPPAKPPMLKRLRDQRPLLLLLREKEDTTRIAGRPEAFAQKLSDGGLYSLPVNYYSQSPVVRRAAVAAVLKRVETNTYATDEFAFWPDTIELPGRKDASPLSASFSAGKKLAFSYWMDFSVSPIIVNAKFFYFASGQRVGYGSQRNDACIVAALPGRTFLIEHSLSPPAIADSVAIVMHSSRNRKVWNVMLRTGDVYRRNNGVYEYNNRPFYE